MSARAVRNPKRAVAELLRRRTAALLNPPQVKFDGDVPFQHGRVLCVPTRPGVYMIADKRGPLYIGRSTNLRERFEQHRKHSHNRLVRAAIEAPVGELVFSWALAGQEVIADLEVELIQAFQPLCNQTFTVLAVDSHQSQPKQPENI